MAVIRRTSPRIFLLCGLLMLGSGSLWAHPHVFITSLVKIQAKSATIAKVSVSWTFDELFSQMVAADYDRDKKGYFTPEEAAEVKKGAFDNLKNFHYFLALFVDGKARPLPPIQDFVPSISDGRLNYAFSLDLDLKVPDAGREVRLTIYDDTYYVAFDKMSPADVQLEGDGSVKADVSIVKTKVKAEWPGQFMPDQILIRLRKS